MHRMKEIGNIHVLKKLLPNGNTNLPLEKFLNEKLLSLWKSCDK